MKLVIALLALFIAAPVSAATYRYNLIFTRDWVPELQTGWQSDGVDNLCRYGEACYPENWRLPTGYFSDLTPGQTTSATWSPEGGRVADWEILGSYAGPGLFISVIPTGGTRFTDLTVAVSSEGPGRFNYVPSCDPDADHPELPDGFCGYYGYVAEFEVVSVSEVPLPASAFFLLSALGYGYLKLRRPVDRHA